MTMDEIILMCSKLAGRYKSKKHFEDLRQEGILSCLEILQDDPKAHPARLYRAASNSMHDYLNLKQLPVSVPLSRATRTIAKGSKWDDTQNYSDNSVDWLVMIIKGSHGYIDDSGHPSMVVDDNIEDQVSDRELMEKVLKALPELLSRFEFEILRMRYYEDMTQDEVADELGTYKMAVSRAETEAISKLRNKFCYNL